MAAVLATYGLSVVLLLMPGDRLADLAVGCWTALRHGQVPELDEAVGALGVVVLLLAAGRFAFAAIRGLRSRRRAHLTYLSVVDPQGAASPQILWLEHAEPLAYSLAGRPGLVVASSGLNRLPAEQVTAVLCHERAHLLGRHHLLTAVTGALAKALPLVPLFRQARAAIGLLVELAADAAAVRVCGPNAVRAALLTLDVQPTPAHGPAMAGDSVPLRLQQLGHPPPVMHVGRQAIARARSVASQGLPPWVRQVGDVDHRGTGQRVRTRAPVR